MDGVDAVAVQIEGHQLDMTASFLSMRSIGLGEYQPLLRALAEHGGSDDALQNAARGVGAITNEAIHALNLHHIDLIALHGQTIYHQPPHSTQLIDVHPITASFDCTVLTDPRQQDLQLGGQGAPITPLADWIMFRSKDTSSAIINLGGFCNVTLLPKNCTPNDISGFDVCCCNLLLNALARNALGVEFDSGGERALQGEVQESMTVNLLEKLLQQRDAHRSLGTNDNLGEFAIELSKGMNPNDALASAIAAIGECIRLSIAGVDRVVVAGGGVHNTALVNAIPHHVTTTALGVPIQAREGMAMAILGALSQDGVSITLPQITGRQQTADVVGWTHAKP